MDAVPLCVDLDGTLVATDTLWESVRRIVGRRPWRLPGLGLALLRGRVAFKAVTAAADDFEADALPYREEVLDLVRRARSEGRPVLLVTAAHESVALEVAAHLGLFDEVLATGDEENLKGAAKAAVLEGRFGRGGFDYVGDSTADLAVFAVARRAFLVAPSGSMARRARALTEGRGETICRRPARLKALVAALRPHQWSKNALILAPALMGHDLPAASQALAGIFAFVAFSLCASAGYVLNDLVDLDADRRHRSKRRRPFARGDLPLYWGPFLVVALLAVSAGLAWIATPPIFVGLLGFYFLLSLGYSYAFKRRPVIDVLVLAGLYTLRLLSGGVAMGIEISAWLLAFSTFLFFSLAMAKRYTELLALEGGRDEKIGRRGYLRRDLEMVASMGPAAGYIAVLVFALYLNSDRVRMNYEEPFVLWLAAPLLLYWITRIWFLAHRGELDDDPVKFALVDPESWVCAGLVLLIAALARYLPNIDLIQLVP
ncbi:MAG: UbiA family prenyltransferase [Acidobacteriota bacterium]|nr:UbiA family prenyltransferase [Acidobacteriota bacterium]MDQ7087095.1 UbiA family prenyltransferase [Acidobacteriota bacterium]